MRYCVWNRSGNYKVLSRWQDLPLSHPYGWFSGAPVFPHCLPALLAEACDENVNAMLGSLGNPASTSLPN